MRALTVVVSLEQEYEERTKIDARYIIAIPLLERHTGRSVVI